MDAKRPKTQGLRIKQNGLLGDFRREIRGDGLE